ncbi:longevity assurance proteins LAG1/LAC1 [Tothia fuscella]|uniref:Longevity assurance proteins LAG1/LAC1 n=1 Tax=Tothia fuscella TaxID=1048955 RepID=A0A9P4TX48_9PEZI|nr:longevity assurance proteins LAG1/LAC1 [Tothia fuscella]
MSYQTSNGSMASPRKKTTRRRRGSNLGGELHGDTDAPALATMNDLQSPPPGSPLSAVSPGPSRQNSDRPTRGRKRRKVKSFFKRWKSYSIRNTWFNPLIICVAVASIYLAKPGPSNPVRSAIFLSYPLPPSPNDSPDTPVQYGKGSKDFAFVAFYTVFLSFTREFLMQKFLRPAAIKAGMKTRGRQARFMEQAYTAIYFAFLGPFGLYVMSRTPVWYYNIEGMYQGFPHMTHEAIFKGYYLLQASYWAQQMIVLLLMLEKPRPDFPQLVAHHIITLSLVFLSYRFHFTYIGLAVYITHDISDFFLATSKLLNYMQSSIIVPYFILFLSMWAYLRHYINLSILVSLLPLPLPFPDVVNNQIGQAFYFASNSSSGLLGPVKAIAGTTASLFPANASLIYAAQSKVGHFLHGEAAFASIGPYELNWATQQYKCWISQWIAFGLLMSLQLVNMYWFYLILKILYRLAADSHLDDVRSEDEDDEEELEVKREDLEELRKEQGAISEKP